MIVDLDTCEWRNPGANPSMVTIEQAVARGVPAADRAELLRQFNTRERFDLVRIHRDRIEGEGGRAAYASVVSNMNFGSGGLCKTVTRTSWSAADYQGAMVFRVNSHFYGYAAVCRNLFTLLGRDVPAGAIPPAALVPPPIATPLEAPPLALLPPMVITEIPADSFEGQIPGTPSVFFTPLLVFGGLVPVPYPVPTLPSGLTPAIPEPRLWFLLLTGLAFIFAVVRRGVRR